MSSIFISYRREDAEGQAGRLYDDLVKVFGSESVFMDVTAIQFGRDFRKAIDQSLASCGAFLSIIGKSWLTAQDASGRRRLEDPADFVRLETAAALQRDIPVIPVLVQGAASPKPDQLPDDLKELAYRNAIELTHARWDSDVQLLINALRPYTSNPEPKPPIRGQWTRSTRVMLAIVTLLAAAGLIALLWPALKHPVSDQTQKALDSPAPEVTRKLANPDLGTGSKEIPAKKTAATESKIQLGEAANAPASAISPGDAIRRALQLFVDKKPLQQQPKRDRYTLSIKVPEQMLPQISRVHYDFIYEPNPLSIDGGPPPDFSAVYDGWGCYPNVAVSVYLTGAESVKKTFNMCTILDPSSAKE